MTERVSRGFREAAKRLARPRGRRTLLAWLGFVLVGGGVLAVLPVARATEPAPAGSECPDGDPKTCEHWRYCAVDGMLCSCCGGTADSCPPGTEMGPVTWVGTCRNPADGKDYLISYNDCCGKTPCGRCPCTRNEGERPDYHWYRNNDINWCAGARSSEAYHCSTARVIGLATEAQPEK